MIALKNILSQEIIQKLGWTLLHFVWQAAVVALLLAILLRLLQKSNANLRYIIACSTLGLIVLLPFITIQLVPVSIPLPAGPIEPASAPIVLPTVEMPAAETIVVEKHVQLESVTLVSADSWKQRSIETLEPALPYIVSVWLVGVFGLSIWHLGGWAQLQRLRRKMVKQIDASLHSKLKVLAERLGINTAVRLMESALVQIPTVIGWLRPVILLPASALTGLTSEQLEAILAHELAHIKRYDYLINMLQTVVEILGFYHPAVWWVSHKIRAERENCCDDLAVSISGDRVCYAKALTSMEEIRADYGQLAVAADGSNLFKRICRLLGKNSVEKTGLSWIPATTAILLIIALAIPTTLALTAKSNLQQAAPKTDSDIPSPTTCTGKIVDSKGDSLASANVAAYEEYFDMAGNVKLRLIGEKVTKDDGNFLFETRPSVRKNRSMGAEVVARKEGLALGWAHWPLYGNQQVTITLQEPTKLSGRVVDENGESVPNAEVRAVLFENKTTQEGKVSWLPGIQPFNGLLVRTDKNGRFEFNNIPENVASDLLVTAPGFSTIYTRKPDIMGYEGAEFTAGQTDIKITMPAEARIEGKVVNKRTGEGIAGITLRVVPHFTPVFFERYLCTTKEDGTFNIGGLRSGKYVIIRPGTNYPKVDVVVESGKTTRNVILKCPYEVRNPKPAGNRIITPKENEQESDVQLEGKVSMEQQVYDISDLVVTAADANDLIHQITTTIEPDSWYDLSDTGEGTITAYPVRQPKNFAVLQTRKIHQQIQRLLEDMHASQGNQIKTKTAIQVEDSAKKSSYFGRALRALFKYVKDHDDKYPDSMQELREYLNEEEFEWTLANVEFSAKGPTIVVRPNVLKAYDKTLPERRPQLLEQMDHQQAIKTQEMQKLRQEYINNDPRVKSLSEKIANAETELIAARQNLPPSHPEVRKKTVFLQILKKHLDDKIKEVGKSFDDTITKETYKTYKANQEKIAKLLDELREPNLPLAPEVPLITNTFIDEELPEALKDIGSMAGIPIIPDEKVIGLVTAELKDVPLEKALEIVLAGTPYVVKKTPYYYLVSSAVELPEIQKRVESDKKLSNLGHALLIYANDHDDKYPLSLRRLQDYLDLEAFNWALANVEYLAHGKTIAVRPDTVIAYDKTLLAARKGTNVLFNDSHVEFVKPERLKKLGISATEILFETRILSVSEDFLKDIGLDANSVHTSDAWSEHLVADSAAEPNSTTYSLILDDLHISFLLKAVGAHKGASMLASPQVLTREGKTAEIGIMTEEYYVLGYTEPNRPSDEPEPKTDKVEVDTRIWLKPELTPDSEKIKLDFKMEIRQLLGYEERKYKGKFIYLIPRTELVSTGMLCLIPDGKTLLIGGLKITEQESSARVLSKLPVVGGLFRSRDKIKEQRALLILIKPTTHPQQKAKKILPGQEDSEEHIKSLANQLEKKLNSPAD